MNETELADTPASKHIEVKQDFDFDALSKLKKQEKKKLIIFSVVLVSLTIMLITFVVLYVYRSLNEQEHENKTEKLAVKVVTLPRYGDECTIDYKCGRYAFCRSFSHGTHKCDCVHGFYGDDTGECRNGYFGIDFKTPTTTNIPSLGVVFPQSEALSVCFWFYLHEELTNDMAMFTYTTFIVKGDNALTIWLTKKKEILVSFIGTNFTVAKGPLSVLKKQKWVHLCWVWHFQKSSKLYLDGALQKTMDSSLIKETKSVFPESRGDVLLGQDLDNGHINNPKEMFNGQLTEFFIYSRELTQDDIKSAVQNYPPTEDVVVAWWQFKNTMKGNDIIEIEYPFIHHYFKSK